MKILDFIEIDNYTIDFDKYIPFEINWGSFEARVSCPGYLKIIDKLNNIYILIGINFYKKYIEYFQLILVNNLTHNKKDIKFDERVIISDKYSPVLDVFFNHEGDIHEVNNEVDLFIETDRLKILIGEKTEQLNKLYLLGNFLGIGTDEHNNIKYLEIKFKNDIELKTFLESINS